MNGPPRPVRPAEHPLLRQLRALALPMGDHALFGSGPLLVRGWIDDVGDLDVVARGAAWIIAQDLGRPKRLPAYDLDVVEIGDGITIGTEWRIGDTDVDEVIDEAELVDGIPCARLAHVVAYKRIADRPKDCAHLAVIARHLSE